eukprot:RCo054487
MQGGPPVEAGAMSTCGESEMEVVPPATSIQAHSLTVPMFPVSEPVASAVVALSPVVAQCDPPDDVAVILPDDLPNSALTCSAEQPCSVHADEDPCEDNNDHLLPIFETLSGPSGLADSVVDQLRGELRAALPMTHSSSSSKAALQRREWGLRVSTELPSVDLEDQVQSSPVFRTRQPGLSFLGAHRSLSEALPPNRRTHPLVNMINRVHQRQSTARLLFSLRRARRHISSSSGHPAPPVTTFFCSICQSNERLEDAVTLPQCAHRFCRECLTQYVASGVTEGSTVLVCPHVGETGACGRLLTDAEIEQFLDADLAQRFARLRNMRGDPTMRDCPFCQLPQKGQPEAPKMTCPRCHREFCFTHSNAHPPSMSCAAYERMSRLKDLRSTAVIFRTSRTCPGCHSLTHKFTGCNHMTCSQCRQEWCWLCGAKLNQGAMSVYEHYSEGGCAGMQFTMPALYYLRISVVWLARVLAYPVGAVLYLLLGLLCLPVVVLGGSSLRRHVRSPKEAVPFLGILVLVLPAVAVAWALALATWPVACPIMCWLNRREGCKDCFLLCGLYTLCMVFFPGFLIFLAVEEHSVTERVMQVVAVVRV